MGETMSRSFDLLQGAERHNAPATEAGSNLDGTSSTAPVLADELAQIESIIGDSLVKLKAVVEQGAVAARTAKESSERAIAVLETDVGVLKDKLRDTEQSLQSRNDAVKALSTRVALQRAQIVQLEQSLQQVTRAAAHDTERATIAVEKAAALERQLREKDALIAETERHASALKSEVSRLKKGVLEMASSVAMHAKSLIQDNRTERASAMPEDDLIAPRGRPSYPQIPGGSTALLFDR